MHDTLVFPKAEVEGSSGKHEGETEADSGGHDAALSVSLRGVCYEALLHPHPNGSY